MINVDIGQLQKSVLIQINGFFRSFHYSNTREKNKIYLIFV